jgi:hypothetical protein
LQGIYNYVPETNHVSRVKKVAPVLYLQFVLLVMLFRRSTMFCAVTLVLPEVCVECPIWLFFAVRFYYCYYYIHNIQENAFILMNAIRYKAVA